MATLAEMLRRKKQGEADTIGVKRNADLWQGLAQNQQPYTVGGGGYGGVPAPQEINYGGILQNAVSSFMSARANKKLGEAQARNDRLTQEFAEETLRDDPQAMKLYSMAQNGIPGADKALADYLAPKKQAVAGLYQAAGQLPPDADDETYEGIGKQYGMSGKMVKSIVQGAHETARSVADEKQADALELINARESKADARAAARNATTIEAARMRGAGGSGVIPKGAVEKEDGTVDYSRTQVPPYAGNFKQKKLDEISKSASGLGSSVSQFDSMYNGLSKLSDAEWNRQGAAKLASEKLGPLGEFLGERTKAMPVKQLENYLMSTVLDRMKILGGNDSNEELQRMRADLPSVYNGKEEALALLKNIDRWQKITMRAGELERKYYASNQFHFEPGKDSGQFYREAEAELGIPRTELTPKGPVAPPQAPPAPAAPQGAPPGGIKFLGFE